MAVFTRELGTYAQRLATIARGDAVCTTFIPISTIPFERHRATPSTTRQLHRRIIRSTAAPPNSKTQQDRTTAAVPVRMLH